MRAGETTTVVVMGEPVKIRLTGKDDPVHSRHRRV